MKFDGGCHCGAIKFRAEADLQEARLCHCTDCQQLSGSAFRTVLPTVEDGFELLAGEPKVYVKIAESGRQREQAFCADCGTHIYATSVGGGPKIYGVRVGTLHQRDQIVPRLQIWCRSARSWLGELDSIPNVEKQIPGVGGGQERVGIAQTMRVDGACHCGKITYEAEVDPESARICHCTDCQTMGGSAFRMAVPSRVDDFTVTSGNPKIYVKIAESGNPRAQAFCPDCGTHIYNFPNGEGPKVYNVRTSTVRQRDQIVPKFQGWHRSAQGWLPELAAIPKRDTQ